MMTKLFNRNETTTQVYVGSGANATFDADGVAEVTAATAALVLPRSPDVYEIGTPAIDVEAATAGNVAVTKAVPTGKWWRLIAATITLTTNGTAGDRTPTITTRDDGDTTIEALAGDAVAASQTDDVTTLVYGPTGVADEATVNSAVDWPTAGVVLGPAEDVHVEIDGGLAGDSFDVALVYIQYDVDPR